MTEVYQGMTLNELLILLKHEVKEITLDDLYSLSYYFNEEKKYLPGEYKKKYTESVLNVIMSRFTSLKNNDKTYSGTLLNKDVKSINELLKDSENIITYLLNIIVIYATYYLKEPVHLPGTIFPGHVSVYYDGKEYYCPVKKYHINSIKSVCKYCIAKNTKE